MRKTFQRFWNLSLPLAAQPSPYTNEELGALAALAAEGDPQRRGVRPAATEAVLDDAGEGVAGRRQRVERPAVQPAQVRLDVALGQRLAQLHERLADGEAVAPALGVHPSAAVALLQFAEEAERVVAEAGEFGGAVRRREQAREDER